MTRIEDRLAEAPAVRAVRDALPAGPRAWLVGGAVRDAALGRPLTDVDIAVEGDPKAAADAIAGRLAGPRFPLSEEFGAWRVIDAERRFTCDVSALQGATIEEDLARRDFTVNAIAVPAEGGASNLVDIVRDLRDAGIQIDDVALRRPTLDDVFLSLTGHATVEEEMQEGAAA